MFNAFWHNLSRSSRTSLIIGVTAIFLATAVLGYWLLKTDYQVLFSDMSAQDTASMIAELDKAKIPYKLSDSGTTILVDRDIVHKTRLKLMGKDLPLHGAVGLELFNNTDFGITEFAQKINYQRALQGEITRTILSLSEIRDVRVHLAIPEQGLFKQQNSHTKAAINVTLKQGESLRRDQINGIQRLVASSVPGISTQDVTIVDQHGVALTRPSQTDAEGDANSSSLELKTETENYISRKVTQVLDKTFGVGQAVASVDVNLNMDQIRSTQESVIAPPSRDGQAQTGVVLRERETVHEGNDVLENKGDSSGSGRGGSSQREVDYQVGRKVEQVVSQPGSIRQLQVAVVVRKALNDDQIEQVRKIVAAAAGFSKERGDTVEIQSLTGLVSSAESSMMTADNSKSKDVGPSDERARVDTKISNGSTNSLQSIVVGLALFLVLALAALIALLTRKRILPNQKALLTNDQREKALFQIQNWLQHDKKIGEHS